MILHNYQPDAIHAMITSSVRYAACRLTQVSHRQYVIPHNYQPDVIHSIMQITCTRCKSSSRSSLQVVDETFALMGNAVLTVLSDPYKLAWIMVGLLACALAGLVLGNTATVAGTGGRVGI